MIELFAKFYAGGFYLYCVVLYLTSIVNLVHRGKDYEEPFFLATIILIVVLILDHSQEILLW